MRSNSKGEGGFMESMIALIAIITVLTVFMSVLPAAFQHDENETMSFDVSRLSVIDGELRFEHDVNGILIKNDLRGIVLIVDVLGTDMRFRTEAGDISGLLERSDSEVFLIDVDGRTMNARYELGVWK